MNARRKVDGAASSDLARRPATKILHAAKVEAMKRVDAAEEEYLDLRSRLDTAERRLAEARQARAAIEDHEREDRQRLHGLAAAVVDGRDAAVPDEDAAVVAVLVPQLREARAARAHEERAALCEIYLPLQQYQQGEPARRRGFADVDDE